MEGWQGTQTATLLFPDAIFPAQSPAAGAELSAQAERGSVPFLEVLRTPAPAAGAHRPLARQEAAWALEVAQAEPGCQECVSG